MHIALTNLLFYVVPVVEGETYWRGLLSSFQTMCRSQSRLFYDVFRDTLEQARSEQVKALLSSVQVGLGLFDYSRERNKEQLDLPVTLMLSLMSRWRSTVEGELTLIHDDSSAMFRSRQDWNTLTADRPTIPTLNSRGSQLPVSLSSTSAQPSHFHRGLQLADVLAGSVCKYLTWIARGKPSDDAYAARLAEVMGDLVFADGVADGLWPSLAFTPEELDRVGDDGSVVLDHIMKTYGIVNR